MGNSTAARLSGRDQGGREGSAGTGQSRLAVFGPLFGGTAIKRPWYCATQQGARHPRWKPHGLAPAYRAVNKTRWDTAVGARCSLSLPTQPRSPEADQAETQICPAGFPSAVTTLLYNAPPPPPLPSSLSLSHIHTHARALTLNRTDSCFSFNFQFRYMETILQLK